MADQKDEKTPLEAEILREVAEEIKEEQFKQLWKKIGPAVVGLIIAALVITGGILPPRSKTTRFGRIRTAADGFVPD